MESFYTFITVLNNWVWGPPTLILLLGTGIYLTILLKGIQFRQLLPALHMAFIQRDEKNAEGDVSHFQALMTALAATVGTGNIAGVATAIAIGGPGALFWMWMTGLIGMATKYTEAYLAVRFRRKTANGTMEGGPMHYIAEGLGLKWLGSLFALFAVIASFGIGSMVQSNSMADVLDSSLGISPWVSGPILTLGAIIVIIGGIRSIAATATAIVPVMVILYVVSGLIILGIHADKIPAAIMMIFRDAFTGTAATGGFAGAGVMMAIRFGMARGIFSNEAGLGSGAIAAAAAKTSKPETQALVSMTQTFLDTLIVCSITGLVIIVTGAWTQTNTLGQALTGATLTSTAFSIGLPGNIGHIIVTIGLALFSFSTVLGWAYFGEKSLTSLFGEKAILPYRVLFCSSVMVGAMIELSLVWNIADITNGLMAIPNLIGLIGLAKLVSRRI